MKSEKEREVGKRVLGDDCYQLDRLLLIEKIVIDRKQIIVFKLFPRDCFIDRNDGYQ